MNQFQGRCDSAVNLQGDYVQLGQNKTEIQLSSGRMCDVCVPMCLYVCMIVRSVLYAV